MSDPRIAPLPFTVLVFGIMAAFVALMFHGHGESSPESETPTVIDAPEAGGEETIPPPSLPLPDLASLGQPFQSMGASEPFGAVTLSDRIDGRADLYLQAGFRSLLCQRYVDPADSSRWMQAFIYDMATSANAFSVFSAQRRPGPSDPDIGPNSYTSENGAFFASGPFYVEVIASKADPSMVAMARGFALAFIQPFQGTEAPLTPDRLLPVEGLMEGSLTHIARDAFGCDTMDDVFTATYDMGGVRLTAWVALRATAPETTALATAYVEFLVSLGATKTAIDTIPGGQALALLGTTIVFQAGRVVAGVQEADDPAAALHLAEALHQRIVQEAP